jgi:phosphoserine phosphatase RsbU/P
VVDDTHSFQDRILEAAERRPTLLLVDNLDPSTVPGTLEIARRGLRIVGQLDAPLRGRSVYRQLAAYGASPEHLLGLTWILSIQRLPTLCTECRRAALPTAADLKLLDGMLQLLQASGAEVEPPLEASPVVSDAPGCAKCHFTGRMGDASVIEISQVKQGDVETRLPVQACLWRLFQRGLLPLRDLIYYDQDLLQRTFIQLAETQQVLTTVQRRMDRSRSELAALQRVLEHRNQALFSIQDIGDALIRSVDLYDMAERVCRRATELCSADRSILYYLCGDDQVEVAAVSGWQGVKVHQRLPSGQVFRPRQVDTPINYNGLPPGVEEPHKDRRSSPSGLFVPLVAQSERVGAMVIQSTQQRRFQPGETAMLQAFANQAALALQRAGLVESLRQKIAALESAQAGLAEKERMAREMELARQVQQSVLPSMLPQVPGYCFAAYSEAARQVGGDFYDVIDLDADHFALAVADVSDKGMPAAMYMVLTRSLLVAQARREHSPAQVLREVNQLLNELSTAGMFVTVFYAVINKQTGSMRYARAGHDRPVLMRQGQQLELGGKGIALGVLEQDTFYVEEQQMQLAPGDRLVLYTDGLTDVMTPEQELYGHERLLLLLQSLAHLPPQEFSNSIHRALGDFQNGAEQFDDMTMLVMEAALQ